MKKRKIAIIIFGILLAVNLLGNVYLVNETVKAEAITSEAQVKLDESTVNLEANKNTLKELNASIETAKKENVTLLSQVPADPSKVLSSGITLGEAKHKIDSIVAGIKALGDTVDNNMDYINKQCEQMGTTYDEIKRLPETATQTQAQGAPVQQTQTQAPAKVNPKHDNTPKQEVQQQAPAKTQVSQPASSGNASQYPASDPRSKGPHGQGSTGSNGKLSQNMQNSGN